MTPITRHVLLCGTAVALAFAAIGEALASGEVNVYSSRHYDVDQQLYGGFTEATGITVNIIEGDSEALLQRIRSEGVNSPADVLIAVDAGRLWRADQQGLFQPVKSVELEERIPLDLRHPDGHYFGFSTRARIIYWDRRRFDTPPALTYEDLADPRLAGEVCSRSSSNVYNLSLMSSLIEAHGEDAALAWAEGVVANFARPPQGGDTDQIRGVDAGECGVALANHYYYLRLLAEDPGITARVGWVFPNQDDRGTHVNIGGAGVLAHSPNRDHAVALLEYLAGDTGQRFFADGNNEYPVVEGLAPSELAQTLGDFERQEINVSVYGDNQPRAQMLFDRAGWP
jgi:iron(III) transport system substrate-binding protein